MGTPRFIPENIVPTPEQLSIQTATDKFVLVEANAGAAKTTTLALRMAESLEFKIPPEKILALTYTEPACDALRKALKKIGVRADVARRLRISTFEAFASATLRQLEGAPTTALMTPELLKPHVMRALLRVENNAEEGWPDELLFPAGGDALVEEFLRQSLHLKGTMRLEYELEDGSISPHTADSLGCNYALLKTFRVYENARRRGGDDHPLFRGLGDATYDLARLIWSHNLETPAPGWPVGIRMVAVDEMHDMNQSMFVILDRILTSNREAFFCGAGDKDQVIHRMAGAEAKFMDDAMSDCGKRGISRYPLTASYRFGAALATVAGRLAKKPYATQSEVATRVSRRSYSEPSECEESVVAEALQWTANKAMKRKMSELAILLRQGYQSIALENALLRAGVSYVTAGFDSYLVRPEVLLVRGLLAVAADDFSSVEDQDTRRRILEAFVFFGDIEIKTSVGDQEDQAGLRAQAIRAVIENPRMLSVFYEGQLLRNAQPEVRRRLEASVRVAQQPAGSGMLAAFLAALQVRFLAARVLVGAGPLKEVAGNLAGLQESAATFESAQAFFRSLNEAERKQRVLRQADSILLANVEATKGLEFDHVLIPYLERDVFPDMDAPIEDERNLFYVAVTRAKKFLTLYGHAATPSRFLADAGLRI